MLDAFFIPVNKNILKPFKKTSGTIVSELRIHAGKFPDIKGIDAAILGIGPNADAFRSEFYKLYTHFNDLQLADFGNLNHNGSSGNINAGLSECILAMREAGIIPIIIGEDDNYSEALYKSIQFKHLDTAAVSPFIAFNPDDLAWKLHQKKKLFHTSFIGTQQFLNSASIQQVSAELFQKI